MAVDVLAAVVITAGFVALIVAEDGLSNAAASISWWGLGDGFIGDWFGSVLANLLTSPFYAAGVTVLFLELRASADRRSSPGTPARSRLRSRRATSP